jgi:type I restriction enzyme S subunit
MSEWDTVELKNVCLKIGSGATPKGGNSVYLPEGKFSLIRSQNIRNDAFDHSGLAFIEEHHAEKLSNVCVQEKDVLLNITGDSVARCCQVDPTVLPARVNQHVAIIRPDPAILDPSFLRYYFVSPVMQNEMLSMAGIGATRNALTKGMIENFEIPLPPLPEQKAIAHILGSLDDKIELNRKMNETLEGMAQALFKSWFVDFDPVIDNILRKNLDRNHFSPDLAKCQRRVESGVKLPV